jgi:hypothetical protein
VQSIEVWVTLSKVKHGWVEKYYSPTSTIFDLCKFKQIFSTTNNVKLFTADQRHNMDMMHLCEEDKRDAKDWVWYEIVRIQEYFVTEEYISCSSPHTCY